MTHYLTALALILVAVFSVTILQIDSVRFTSQRKKYDEKKGERRTYWHYLSTTVAMLSWGEREKGLADK